MSNRLNKSNSIKDLISFFERTYAAPKPQVQTVVNVSNELLMPHNYSTFTITADQQVPIAVKKMANTTVQAPQMRYSTEEKMAAPVRAQIQSNEEDDHHRVIMMMGSMGRASSTSPSLSISSNSSSSASSLNPSTTPSTPATPTTPQSQSPPPPSSRDSNNNQIFVRKSTAITVNHHQHFHFSNNSSSSSASSLSKRKATSFYVQKTSSLSTPRNGNTTNDSNRHVSVHASATSTINRQTSCVGSLINNTNGSSSHNVSATNSFRRRIDPSLKNPQKIVLDWCQARTKNYTNVKITNFSSSWADGLAFCALIHSFMPDSFDYNQLSGQNRKHNFELAFNVAQKRANIEPLLEVSDMLLMGNRPDEKCIYTYLSTIYSRFCSIKSNATSSVNTSNPSRQP